jgi:hypothetical protein
VVDLLGCRKQVEAVHSPDVVVSSRPESMLEDGTTDLGRKACQCQGHRAFGLAVVYEFGGLESAMYTHEHEVSFLWLRAIEAVYTRLSLSARTSHVAYPTSDSPSI